MECAVEDRHMVKAEHLLVQLLTLRQETYTSYAQAAHTVVMHAVTMKILHAARSLVQPAMA